MPKSLRTLTNLFFAIGFFTCTWDLLLKYDTFGFTFKIHSLFFLLSFLLSIYFRKGHWNVDLKEICKIRFIQVFFLIFIFYLASTAWSTYPLKTFLYSCWLGFNILVIAISAQLLPIASSEKFFSRLIYWTCLFLSSIILIDSVAYQFGYISGFLGWNQDALLNWGVSRPSAFSSEPSYIASFLSTALIFLLPFILNKPNRIVNVVILLYILTAIFLTTSRTGVGAVLLGGAIYVFCYLIQKKKMPWRELLYGVTSILAISTACWLAYPDTQRKKFHRELIFPVVEWHDASHLARLRSLGIAWEIAKETNFIGTGLGASFSYWLRKDVVRVDHKESELKEAHSSDRGKEVIMSTWGQVLAEGGLFVLVAYLYAAIYLIRVHYKKWRSNFDSLHLASFVSGTVFFFFTAIWLGNIARGDVWVWYAIWIALSHRPANQLSRPVDAGQI